ncbi:MAG: nicotinate-nicotinamide nucleotide adenylyltransferase [Actinomycetota bacterium]
MDLGGEYDAQGHMTVDAFDLDTIFTLRALYNALDQSSVPSIATLKRPGPCRTVALLPGSFNPPTAAHMLLGERALREGFDCVLLLLARNTVGKEASGLIPEDRLLAMRAAANSTLGVAVASHGLYADQAQAARALYPDAEITFLVGSDKVVQIFEDRWYDDRDAALERLFGLARLVVAPRSDQGELLREVLDAPENRRFADSVSVLRLHPAVSDLSSTRVRGLLRAGAEPAGLVPSSVAELLTAMRAFAPPVVIGDEEIDAYELRAKLIDALWRERDGSARDADLRRLVMTALSATREGARLRNAISNGGIHADELMGARASGL